MPARPPRQPCQTADTEFPSGVNAPMPVTTTRVPFLPAMRGTSEPLVLRPLPLSRGGGPAPRPRRTASPSDILPPRPPPPPAPRPPRTPAPSDILPPRPPPPPAPRPAPRPLLVRLWHQRRPGGTRLPLLAAASPADGGAGLQSPPMQRGPALPPGRSRLCPL